MEWIAEWGEWIKVALEQAGTSLFALPLAFLLGLVSAIASACCTLPVFGAIVGYAGTRTEIDKRSNFLGACFFMIGTIIALLILGSVAGLIGQVAQSVLGKYWKMFAGFIAIIVGLGTLKLIPLKFIKNKKGKMENKHRGIFGAAIFGLIMGGAVSVCSLACNPGIFIILGVAVLQGYTFWMFGILIAYAIGFSLPLTALMLGVSLGKSTVKAKNTEAVIRVIAGIVLIGVGFYFLSSI
jgi:cytochrome c biogenesis protein CcdA